jgi:hypothetical protein
MATRFPLLSLLALAVGVASAGGPQETTTFRYKFKSGDELNYVVSYTSTTESRTPALAGKTDLQQVVDLRWKFESVDAEGTAEISVRVLRVRVRLAGPLGRGDYDTKGDKASTPVVRLFAQPLRLLIGEEVRLTLDARGRLKGFKPSGQLTGALDKLKAVAGAVGAGDAVALFSEERLKGLLELAGAVFPEGPVSKGMSWKGRVAQQTPFGRLAVDAKVTAQGPAGKKGEKITSQLKGVFEADPKYRGMVKLTSAGGKGSVLFDAAAGRLVEAALTQTTALTIRAMNQNGSLRTRTVLTMKLRK